MVHRVHVSSNGPKRMLSQNCNRYDLFLSTCLFPHLYMVCLFAKSPEVSYFFAFPEVFSKDFPRFALHRTEAPCGHSALARCCTQPLPLLMQALHTSCCYPGTLLQQWLRAQISSKTAPGIDALCFGSLNPAAVPNPICLVVKRHHLSPG